MTFRGIFASIAATLSVVAIAVSANAAKLVVTDVQDHSTNSLIPNGDKVFTVGVLIQPGDGTGIVSISAIFTGGLTGPIQQPATGAISNRVGVPDLQTLQNNIDNGNTVTSTNLARAADTWFYAGAATPVGTSGFPGQLITAGPDIDNPLSPEIPVVGDPSLSGHGLSPNPNSLVWVASPTQIIDNTTATNKTIAFQGYYGVATATPLDNPLLLASQIAPGTIIPFVQIVANGNIGIQVGTDPAVAQGGLGLGFLGISTVNHDTNVFGNAPSDPAGIGAFISFNATTNPLAINATPAPEPSTLALAGLGLVGALLVRRRRK